MYRRAYESRYCTEFNGKYY
uniref:Uncharacterized protein n=1 Tax=Anguilla anguilla TaxID=7936 RepID=A0A0E9V8N2_ANGAN